MRQLRRTIQRGEPVTRHRHGSISAPVYLSNLRFFAHVFRSIGSAVIVTDPSGRITHVNPVAERLYGWGPGELVDRSVDALVAPGHEPPPLQDILETGEAWDGESQHRRKSGAVFPVRLNVAPILDDAEGAIGLVWLILDDTPSQRQRDRLRSLVALGAALNAESDPEKLLGQLCREAREIFAVDGVYLLRFDEKSQQLIGLAGDGPGADQFPGWRVPLAATSCAAAALRSQRPAIQNHFDPNTLPGEAAHRCQTRSALAVPLLRGERPLGVLVFADTERYERFHLDDAKLAQTFTELAAVALDDARIHAAERAKAERLLALTRVTQLLSASLEQDVVLDAIAEGAQRLLNVDDVHILLLDTPQGPLRLANSRSTVGGRPPSELPFHRSWMGEVIRTGRPWQSSNVQAEPPRFGWSYAESHQLHACLMVPLIANGQPLGGIAVFSREIRSFDQEEVELMLAFGHQAALAVQNAQTFARVRLADRLERLLQTSKRLHPRDREHVNQLLVAAERLIELSSQAEQESQRATVAEAPPAS